MVSSAVDRAEKQRRLFKAGRKQEKHLVMEVVDEEGEKLMEKLKSERLKRSEEKRSRYWKMELEETRESLTTNPQSLLNYFYTKFKYQNQEEENARRASYGGGQESVEESEAEVKWPYRGGPE